MPSGTHEMKLSAPIEDIWIFVSDMDKWAPLVPGYIEHNILNENQSIWVFTGDIGIIQKTIHLQVDIVEWIAPDKIAFHLTGLHESFIGTGYFNAQQVNKKTTNMTGHLNITAKGVMGPMINTILKSLLPKITKEFTISVAKQISERETVNY